MRYSNKIFTAALFLPCFFIICNCFALEYQNKEIKFNYTTVKQEKILSDEQCIERISKQLINVVKGQKQPTVSIFPLTYADGTYSAEGYILSDFLFSEMSEKTKIKFVERENIDKIIDEMVLSAGKYTKKELLGKGKLLKCDFFVFGTLLDLGDKLKVTIRFADSSNGEIIKSDSFNINRRIKDSQNPVWDDIAKIKRSGKRFEIKTWTEKRKVKIGDDLTIFFQAKQNCYVNIFSLGTSGKLMMLYPNRIHKNNYIKANKRYSIPSLNDSFTIKATGPKGINKIKIFAVTKNIPLKLKSSKPSFFREIKAENAERFRDFEVLMKNTKDNQWAEAQWELILE